MEIDVENIEQRPNVLLNRTEVRFKVFHKGEATPKRETLREALAELMNVKKEQVIINELDQEFGRNETLCYAKVYKKKDMALTIERDHMLKRHNMGKPKREPGKPKTEGGDRPAKSAGE